MRSNIHHRNVAFCCVNQLFLFKYTGIPCTVYTIQCIHLFKKDFGGVQNENWSPVQGYDSNRLAGMVRYSETPLYRDNDLLVFKPNFWDYDVIR